MLQLSRIIPLVLLAFVMFAFALAPDMARAEITSPTPGIPTVLATQLTGINKLHDKAHAVWKAEYNTLRKNVVYNWVDWSQDECSTPWYVPEAAVKEFEEKFLYGCLRHDMASRTLPIVDAGTGRIWNERNRLASDEKFKDDNIDACAVAYPDREDSSMLPTDAAPAVMRGKCNAAARLFYGGVRLRYGLEPVITALLGNAEARSVTADPSYKRYPETGTVDCSSSSSRCLPVHYMIVSGRPFSPQNLDYIANEQTVTFHVVRAHLQYRKGAPSSAGINGRGRTGPIGHTGELVLRVHWPFRASTSSADIECPTVLSGTPAAETHYVSSGTYPVSTSDAAWNTASIHVKSCAETTEAQEAAPLIEFFPRRAQYVWDSQQNRAVVKYDDTYTDGKRVRHYQHIETKNCHAVKADLPSDTAGAWLATDCLVPTTDRTRLPHGGYADYYTFTVPSQQKVLIDLSYTADRVDTFLYLLKGSSITASWWAWNDDYQSTNSHLSKTLDKGDYTIIATTFWRDLSTGDYRLHVRPVYGPAPPPAATPGPTATPVPTPAATPPPSASPPTVNAGADKTVNRGANVYVSGTGSPVDDDDDITYAWTQTSGTTVSMLKSSSSVAYVPNVPGSDSFKFVAPSSSATLVFQLTVTDGGTNLPASDSMTVTVR